MSTSQASSAEDLDRFAELLYCPIPGEDPDGFIHFRAEGASLASTGNPAPKSDHLSNTTQPGTAVALSIWRALATFSERRASAAAKLRHRRFPNGCAGAATKKRKRRR